MSVRTMFVQKLSHSKDKKMDVSQMVTPPKKESHWIREMMIICKIKY